MRRLTGLIFAAIPFLFGDAEARVIRSWDDANQRGLDLNTGGAGTLEYGQFKAELLARGHTVFPGVSSITLANLVGVDVFFHGTSDHILSAAEQSALSTFVQSGGCLIVEANSATSEQASANSALAAFGLGSPYNGTTGGGGGSNGGTFSNNVTATTVGPLGDLRNLPFGTSVAADITPTGGTIVGTTGSVTSMVEYEVGAGAVLACGDPYGFNLFMSPGGSSYNPNNAKAYLNFVEKEGGPVGVETTSWSRVKSLYR